MIGKGKAPDRTETVVKRFVAPKGTSARMTDFLNRVRNSPKMREEFFRIANQGAKLSGKDWYNTERLRNKFIDVLGKKEGHQAWSQYMQMIGATSPNMKVPQNIRTASYWFAQDANEMIKRLDDFKAGKMVPPKGSGYGSKTQQYQSTLLGDVFNKNFIDNIDPKRASKPRGFSQSLMGSKQNIAIDMHLQRLLSMTSQDPRFLHSSAVVGSDFYNQISKKFKNMDDYFKVTDLNGKKVYNFNAKKAVAEGKNQHPDAKKIFRFIKNKPQIWDDKPLHSEYGALEELVGELAKDLGMSPAQFQAALWVGAANKTNVDANSLRAFDDIFEEVVQKRAIERGLDPNEVFRQFATKTTPLSLGGLLGLNAFGTDDEVIY